MKTIAKTIIIICLTTSFINAGDLLLIDSSGSMDRRSIKKPIKEMVKSYLNTSNEVLAFNDDVYTVKDKNDLVFKGGTALSKALEHIYSLDIGYVVLVTDGIPDSETKTLLASKKLREKDVKICSVYLTNSSGSTPTVLEQISNQLFSTNEIDQVFKLCTSAVKKKLISGLAVQKRVDTHKFDF